MQILAFLCHCCYAGGVRFNFFICAGHWKKRHGKRPVLFDCILNTLGNSISGTNFHYFQKSSNDFCRHKLWFNVFMNPLDILLKRDQYFQISLLSFLFFHYKIILTEHFIRQHLTNVPYFFIFWCDRKIFETNRIFILSTLIESHNKS